MGKRETHTHTHMEERKCSSLYVSISIHMIFLHRRCRRRFFSLDSSNHFDYSILYFILMHMWIREYSFNEWSDME